MIIGVGFLCRISYFIVSNVTCSVLISSDYVVSVRRGFLCLLELGIGCVVLLWHSLGLPYNYCNWYRPPDLGRSDRFRGCR